MNLETTVNLDGFERWAGRVALYLIIAPPVVFAGTMLLDSGRRVIVAGAYCTTGFLVGFAVKYALRRFKTNLPFAIRLIEKSFYVMCASTIIVLIDDDLARGISAGAIAGDVFMIGILTFIGKKIFQIKRVSISSERTSEGSDG